MLFLTQKKVTQVSLGWVENGALLSGSAGNVITGALKNELLYLAVKIFLLCVVVCGKSI